MKDYLEFLYHYNSWANRRILDASAKLSQDQLLSGSGHGNATPSIRDLLVHIMGAQEIWLARWGGVSPTQLLKPEDFGTVALIEQYWDQVEQHTRAYLDATQDDILSENYTYSNTRGQQFTFPRWQTMVHQVNHATQHRAEIAHLLTGYNASPGDVDVLMYMNQKS